MFGCAMQWDEDSKGDKICCMWQNRGRENCALARWQKGQKRYPHCTGRCAEADPWDGPQNGWANGRGCLVLKGTMGALICTRKSSRKSALGTGTKTTKVPGTWPGTAADRRLRPPCTWGSDTGSCAKDRKVIVRFYSARLHTVLEVRLHFWVSHIRRT